MNFGKVLKEIRLANDDSIRGLGEKIDIVFSFIDKVEKGIAPPSEKLYEGVIKVYPLHKKRLSIEYTKDKLPQSILNELNINNTTEDYLDRILIILQMLDVEEQKSILTNIVERVEYNALKKGTAGEIKDLLDEIREKIEEL